MIDFLKINYDLHCHGTQILARLKLVLIQARKPNWPRIHKKEYSEDAPWEQVAILILIKSNRAHCMINQGMAIRLILP